MKNFPIMCNQLRLWTENEESKSCQVDDHFIAQLSKYAFLSFLLSGRKAQVQYKNSNKNNQVQLFRENFGNDFWAHIKNANLLRKFTHNTQKKWKLPKFGSDPWFLVQPMVLFRISQWWIQGSAKHFFMFMQFSERNGQIIGWRSIQVRTPRLGNPGSATENIILCAQLLPGNTTSCLNVMFVVEALPTQRYCRIVPLVSLSSSPQMSSYCHHVQDITSQTADQHWGCGVLFHEDVRYC